MKTLTEQLAEALHAIDETCQAGLNSSVYSHWEAALQDAMRISREALAPPPKPRMHYHPRGFWVPRYERGVSGVLRVDDVVHFNRINGRIP